MDRKLDKEYIGVFDSGVGGLSVLKQLIVDFPNESFLYLGDTARLPYGAKSKDTIKKYVLKNIDYLNKHYKLKAIVVACNSASSVISELDLPVETVGVINAGLIAAERASESKKIALWATRATVSSQAYEKEALKVNDSIEISSTACPTLVSLVEEGVEDHPLFPHAFEFYFQKSSFQKDVDTLILGCTHFPFFKKQLVQFFKTKGLNVKLVDASSEISKQVEKSISKGRNLQPEHIVLVTDEAPHFKKFISAKMPKNSTFNIKKVDI